MLSRFLPPILMLLAMAQATPGDEVPVKAGDAAPAIDWSKIVQSPPDARFNPSLTGQYTVVLFLGPLRVNPLAIQRWNRIVTSFQGQPVQFVCIASKPLAVEGWLLVDETRGIARNWGFENNVGSAIVEPSGRIVGFTRFIYAEQLSNVLAGKAVHLSREPLPFQRPQPPAKPDIPPSLEVHISPSNTQGMDDSSGPDFWVQRGFSLKEMLAIIYDTDETRVDLPKPLDDGRKFDFVAVLPQPEKIEKIHEQARQAIEQYFRISAVVETKPADVYVMTTVAGKITRLTGPESIGGGGYDSSSSTYFSLPAGTEPSAEAIRKVMEEQQRNPSVGSLSAKGSDMKSLLQALQHAVGRPVIDETGLSGSYQIDVKGDALSTSEFIDALREQTGIVLTPATRAIEVITVRAFNKISD